MIGAPRESQDGEHSPPPSAGRVHQSGVPAQSEKGSCCEAHYPGAPSGLDDPPALERAALERAITGLAASRLMIAGAPASFEWSDRSANGAEWREMRLPMLGRAVGYGLRGRHLIISNNTELLASLMTGVQSKRDLQTPSPVHELTVVRLSARRTAFDQIFSKLDEPRIKFYWKERHGEEFKQIGPNEPSMEFFSGEKVENVPGVNEQLRLVADRVMPAFG